MHPSQASGTLGLLPATGNLAPVVSQSFSLFPWRGNLEKAGQCVETAAKSLALVAMTGAHGPRIRC